MAFEYPAISDLYVENYKSLVELEQSFGEFSCIVGKNNSGKSSLLQCLLLLIEGPTLTSDQYYSPDRGITIRATLSGLTDDVLGRLQDDHRAKIVPFVDDGAIRLARVYGSDGKSTLRLVRLMPEDERFDSSVVDDTFRGKSGPEVMDALRHQYPEVCDRVDEPPKTQKAAKSFINQYLSSLDESQLVEKDVPLPSGIDNSIKALFPEVIYVAAVKDVADEIKTKETASFGRLLGVLLNVIEDELQSATETFDQLRRKLTRTMDQQGRIVDERLFRVQEIERAIELNLRESFRDVKVEIEIPPPEIKTILSGASILADDGVRGPIEQKGDGLKRAMAFTILRTYVQLAGDQAWQREGDQPRKRTHYLFLFEEPELCLHPSAQQILFQALTMLASHHQVVTTTHSPVFLSAEDTSRFIKIRKVDPDTGQRPFARTHTVDLSSAREKDLFQMISFETANSAFFADRVLLVEGDSERIVLPHMARILNPDWDFRTHGVHIVRVSGKGSFRRYREFFSAMDVPVHVLADLDVLVEGFNHLCASDEATRLHAALLTEADRMIQEPDLFTAKDLKARASRHDQRRLAKDVVEVWRVYRECQSNADELADAIERFFEFEKFKPRLEIIRSGYSAEVRTAADALTTRLWNEGIYVLRRGEIEDYYPQALEGADKPSKAQSYCRRVDSREDVLAATSRVVDSGVLVDELVEIFSHIFEDLSV